MITVFMSALMLPVRFMASAAAGLIELLPQHRPFELSDDGEHLFASGQRYDFVGFCQDERYIADNGETIRAGMPLGYITGSSGCRVSRTSTRVGTYIMLRGASDCAEVYRLCERTAQ